MLISKNRRQLWFNDFYKELNFQTIFKLLIYKITIVVFIIILYFMKYFLIIKGNLIWNICFKLNETNNKVLSKYI